MASRPLRAALAITAVLSSGRSAAGQTADASIISPGSYQWARYRAEVNSATKRSWVIDAAWSWGGFCGGTLQQVDFGVTLKPSRHVVVSMQGERNAVVLPEGSFATNTLTLRADEGRLEPVFDRVSAKLQSTIRF